MKALVVIENATLDALASRGDLDIPCLAAFRARVSGLKPESCRCRRSVAARERNQAYTEARRCLAALDPESRVRLKAALDARQVRLIYAQPTGKGMQLTF